jgi:carbon starvation protein CstA
MKKTGRKAWLVIIPTVFMLIMASWSLVLQIIPFIKSVGQPVKPDVMISGVVGIILMGLCLWLVIASVAALAKTEKS